MRGPIVQRVDRSAARRRRRRRGDRARRAPAVRTRPRGHQSRAGPSRAERRAGFLTAEASAKAVSPATTTSPSKRARSAGDSRSTDPSVACSSADSAGNDGPEVAGERVDLIAFVGLALVGDPHAQVRRRDELRVDVVVGLLRMRDSLRPRIPARRPRPPEPDSGRPDSWQRTRASRTRRASSGSPPGRAERGVVMRLRGGSVRDACRPATPRRSSRVGRPTRTGIVLMKLPTMRSMPGSSGVRPDTTDPNTTSVASLWRASSTAHAACITSGP